MSTLQGVWRLGIHYRVQTDRRIPHAFDSKTRPRPSFLFLGAGKAGSNWFMEILHEHPEVFIPPNKGTFFFTKHYHLGTRWYELFFSKASERCIGEVCEDYLASPEALARIKDYRPDMRLICCLRNPYERAVSSWRFFARNGIDRATLAAQAEQYPQLFRDGYYATHLEVLHSLFPRDQILIFLFEELASDPESVARRLYQFIDVDSSFVPTSLHQRINPNGTPRSRLIARFVHKIHIRSWGPSRRASNLIGHIKRIRPLRRAVTAALYRQRPTSQAWQAYFSEFPDHIVARYEREIGDLERILCKDLSAWRAPKAGGPQPLHVSPSSQS
jgi:hypothetical protein